MTCLIAQPDALMTPVDYSHLIKENIDLFLSVKMYAEIQNVVISGMMSWNMEKRRWCSPGSVGFPDSGSCYICCYRRKVLVDLTHL